MSDFYCACIQEAMKRRGASPDVSQYTTIDFINAAQNINTYKDALWFSEGAFEEEAMRLGAIHTEKAIEGAKRLILQAVNQITNDTERRTKQAIWFEVFDSYETLIPEKQII